MYAVVTSTVDKTRLNGLNTSSNFMEAITLPRPPFSILHNLGVAFGSIRCISGVEFTWNAPWHYGLPLTKILVTPLHRSMGEANYNNSTHMNSKFDNQHRAIAVTDPAITSSDRA